ncbi:ABC transporter ATP-binding protein [Microvirga rosea]|uniref:ABC transporter ATP-binding protein n=1 Tax=Microvirga rosea TaxID=2715425 RepID=UPI001D0A1684|nr:ABC transporter ATP-binding protein [Microvirga rosea]MCB8822254.1 ABC transporter ATP-binding protein [Microvirga rosea]
MKDLLDIRDLRVNFMTEAGIARAVDGIDVSIAPGQTLAIVGESGCGKSVTSRAIMGLIQPPGWIEGGEIWFAARQGPTDLAQLPPNGRQINAIRGSEITMIFQEPMTALNPVLKIGAQIMEPLLLHEKISKSEAKERAIASLAAVGISSPGQRFDEYPHNLSGGMRQRAMIAMALVCNPSLLIADEPTTALDVTIQAQVLDLMKDLRRDFSGAIMFITHDLGVVATMADHVMVMYRGKVVERAAVRDLYRHPLHPYTQGLLRSVPSIAGRGAKRLATIEGSVPRPTERIRGCAFAPRCPHAMPVCKQDTPALAPVQQDHRAACFLHHAVAEEQAHAA